MYAVIFEVEPRPERRDEYLELAGFLKPELEKIDGFIEVERFASKIWPGRMLSLSIWRDEEAVVRWRSHAGHRRVQHKGRSEIFSGYRLRVGEVVDGPSSDAAGGAVVSISEWTPMNGAPAGGELAAPKSARESMIDFDVFESIYVPGKRLVLLSWRDGAAAAVAAWQPSAPTQEPVRHRVVRIVRDYGLFDRREAPQQFPEIKRTAAE